jgi:hypothetical protein
MQECYFTYSHSPLKDASGKVAGVLSTVIETTARVLTERRMQVLRHLSDASIKAAANAKTIEKTSQPLVDLLCSDNPDAPFAVHYLTHESGRAHLITSKNIDRTIFSSSVAAAESDAWGLGSVLRDRKLLVIEHSPDMSASLPGGTWPEPTRQLVALRGSHQGSTAGQAGT